MFVEGDRQIQLPDGTFDFLFGIASNFSTEVMWSDTRDYTVVVSIEEVCSRTGGSCVDFRVIDRRGSQHLNWFVHITHDNRVLDLSGGPVWTYGLDQQDFSTEAEPDLDGMLRMVNTIYQQTKESIKELRLYSKPLYF